MSRTGPSVSSQRKICLYVTYDCFPREVRDNLKKFNQDISTYEAKKSFLFLDCYSSVAKTESKEEYTLGQPFSLGDLGITLSETMGEMRAPERVIFDSIVPLLTHVDPWKVIEFLQDRSARVKGVNGTLVFSVGKETIESSLANRLEEIVDCIIELDVSEKKGKTVRNLRIRKMSGRKTSDSARARDQVCAPRWQTTIQHLVKTAYARQNLFHASRL